MLNIKSLHLENISFLQSHSEHNFAGYGLVVRIGNTVTLASQVTVVVLARLS